MPSLTKSSFFASDFVSINVITQNGTWHIAASSFSIASGLPISFDPFYAYSANKTWFAYAPPQLLPQIVHLFVDAVSVLWAQDVQGNVYSLQLSFNDP